MCDSEDDNRWESVSDYGTKLDMFVSYGDSEFDEDEEDLDDFDDASFENYFEMAGSLVEVMGATPRMGRRSMALSDIDPKYVSQSGIWEASEVETSRGSIRIQHLTAVANAVPRPLSCATSIGSAPGPSRVGSRFPKLEECAHFHYDILELPLLKIKLRDEPNKYNSTSGDEPSGSNINSSSSSFSIEVFSGSQCWTIRRTYANFKRLDEQLHRCVWDRSFSQLKKVTDDAGSFQAENELDRSTPSEDEQNGLQVRFIKQYLERLSELPTNQITCGTVLSWLEIDNRGRHIVSSDDSAINTPAVAAACAIRQYVAKASDELSFEVGDMISVIDMPPPEESSWWRGKRRFNVGFFPRDCVQVIGEKVHSNLPSVPTSRKQQRLSSVSSASSSANSSSSPDKPVLRKHGKLIAFFRSFILARPSRRRLKESGILRERVFGCDLAEHLLQTGCEIPDVLKCCAEFIELQGIVDGIYRVSGITSNIQKLRNAFDEDRIPNLEEDEAIKQDIHAVSSLVKMYFRELPNPLCTYQLYNKFREAIEACDEDRLLRMREVAQELPPPHYRTLEYLLKHLARVAEHSSQTGMTTRNMAIVWAPNLIRCKDLEAGGVTALKGIGVQAIVTEYLVRHADLIFNDKLSEQLTSSNNALKSLPLSPPIKYLSLDGEQDQSDDDRKYIEVGGGPSSLPAKYHTVIDIPGRRSGLKSKRSAAGWRTFFSRNRSFSKPHRKANEISVGPPTNVQHLQTNWPGRLPLRPVKSVESLVSSNLYHPSSNIATNSTPLNDDTVLELDETAADVETNFCEPPRSVSSSDPEDLVTDSSEDVSKQQNPKTHNRSISHDSYFEFGEFLKKGALYIDETLEEEDDETELKMASETNTNITNESTNRKEVSSVGIGNSETGRSLAHRSSFGDSFVTLETSRPDSSTQRMDDSLAHAVSSSSDDPSIEVDDSTLSKSPLLKPKPRYSILRNAKTYEAETSKSKLFESDTNSSLYSDFEASNSEVHRSYENALNSCHNFKDLSLPLEREAMPASSCDNNMYEIDRNSSIDNSSTDTTPGGDSCNTNIIYSPLVNESAISPGCDKNNGRNDKSVPSKGLFVCPLYESGPKVESGAESTTSLKENKQPRGTRLEPKKSFKTQIRQYENIEILVPSTEDDTFVYNDETPGILWDQDRIYQNIGQHVMPETFDDLYLQQEVRVIHVDGNSVQPQVQEVSSSMVPNEEFDQHYENINALNTSLSDGEEGLYEANIYEDIEDDDDDTTVSNHNSKQDRPPSLPNRNNASPDPRESRMSNVSDISASEAYESVQFGNNSQFTSNKQFDMQPSENNCYGEITAQNSIAAATLFRKISSPCSDSQKTDCSEDQLICQTDSMVTCFDKTPSFEDKNQEIQSDLPNDSTSAALTPSTEGDDEIRHIDSPLVVDNPVYGLEFNEKASSLVCKEIPKESIEKREYLIGRSNSVPLTDNLSTGTEETSLPTIIPDHNINESKRNLSDSKDLNIIDSEILLLWKRLSEPSLCHLKKDEKAAAFDAWKLADAKRLANRKQSVKELLSKFEQKDSISPSSSPTHNMNWKNARNSPGLPRPDKPNSRQQSTTKFQHHRFSIGDILMSQSLTSADAINDTTGYSVMSRSDTYPELRTDSTKENESAPETEISEQGNLSSVLVPEKVQTALRVAMSSVDMNDPTTRERIEKYKEERRLFLRQKISTELDELSNNNCGANDVTSCSTTMISTSPTHPVNLFDRSHSTSAEKDGFSSPKLHSVNVTEDIKSGMESPRKRAFSEDTAQPNYCSNQHKAIKTESSKKTNMPLSNINTTPSVLSVENVELVKDEINVREKVALWTTSSNQERRPYSSPYVESMQRPAYKPKSVLAEACGLPIEGSIATKKLSVAPPVVTLRRELTTGSIDLNKAKLSSRTPGLSPGDSSKKIKDMAAFFEGKHF